jgi:hypothetical protein
MAIELASGSLSFSLELISGFGLHAWTIIRMPRIVKVRRNMFRRLGLKR